MEVRSEMDLPDISSYLSVNLEEGVHMTQTYTAHVDKTHTDTSEAAEKQGTEVDIEGCFRVLGSDVQCLVCCRVMKRSKIRIHLRIHTGERPYECETCFKRFSRSDKLATHKKIHTGERPYQCFCGKRFLRIDHLKTHVTTHNLTIEDSQALIDEARIKDGSKPILSSKRKFLVCPFCNRKFAQSYKYNRHMRLHTGEKPYQCCCGAKYARSERLHRHLCDYPDHWQTEIVPSDQEEVPSAAEGIKSDCIQDLSSIARTDILSPDLWQEQIVSLDPAKGSTCIPSVSDAHPVFSNPILSQRKVSDSIPGASNNHPVLSSLRMEITSDQMDTRHKQTVINYTELPKARLPQDTTVRKRKKPGRKRKCLIDQRRVGTGITADESRVAERSGKLNKNNVVDKSIVKEEVEVEETKREEVDKEARGEEEMTLVDKTEEGRGEEMTTMNVVEEKREDKLMSVKGKKKEKVTLVNKSEEERGEEESEEKEEEERERTIEDKERGVEKEERGEEEEKEREGEKEKIEGEEEEEREEQEQREEEEERGVGEDDKKEQEQEKSRRKKTKSRKAHKSGKKEQYSPKLVLKQPPSHLLLRNIKLEGDEERAKGGKTRFIPPRVESFKCDICGHVFRKIYNLQSHMKIHYERTLFECEVCSKTFKVKKTFEAHMLNHEDVLGQDVSLENARKKRAQCTICGKWMVSPSNLAMHVRSHTGERPYSCRQCSSSFNRKADMVRHLKTHTGEKPYSCQLCPMTFTRRDKLAFHVGKQHQTSECGDGL